MRMYNTIAPIKCNHSHNNNHNHNSHNNHNHSHERWSLRRGFTLTLSRPA